MSGIVAARDAVYQALNGASLDVDWVLDHEPVKLPQGITMTVSFIIADAITPEQLRIAVRVYLPGNLDPQTAQERLGRVMDTAVDALPDTFGPDSWSAYWDQDIGAHIAECVVATVRGFES